MNDLKSNINDKKKLIANIPKDFHVLLSQASKEAGLSMNAYVIQTLKDKIKYQEPELPDFEHIDNNNLDFVDKEDFKSKTISLDYESARALREKSSAIGLTDVAYIRKLIQTKDFKIYNIETEDMRMISEQIGKVVRDLDSTVMMIKKSGKENLYESDLQHIEKCSLTIQETLKNILEEQYKIRRITQRNLERNFKKRK